LAPPSAVLKVKDGCYSLLGEPERSVDFTYNGSILDSMKEE